MTDDSIFTKRIDRTLTITMNRPDSRNALTRDMIQDIAKAFNENAADREIRAAVLIGTGTHFCSGADLRRSLLEDPEMMHKLDGYIDDFHSVIRSIVNFPRPVIAAMDGCAVGFGADMALACDFRIATTLAYLQEKFLKIGLMPDGGGTFWLSRHIGQARAMRAILLAEKIDAQHMNQLGLLTNLVPQEELQEAAYALATDFASNAPLAFTEAKRAIHASLGDLDAALQREREGQLRLLRTADAIEGVMAWANKREPNFKGE